MLRKITKNHWLLFIVPYVRILIISTVLSTFTFAQVPDSVQVEIYLQQLDSITETKKKVALLNGAIADFKFRKDSASLAGFYRKLGLTYFRNTRYDSSRIAYKSSIHISQSLYDTLGMIKGMRTLAGVEAEADNYTTAEKVARQCLNIQEQSGDKNGSASTINTLGVIYQYSGQLKKAEATFLSSLKMSLDIGNPLSEARVRNNLGVTYKSMGLYRDAMLHLKRSEYILDSLYQTKPHMGKMYTYNLLSGTYLLLGLYDYASEYAEALRKQADSLAMPLGQRMYLAQMGKILIDKGNLNEAKKYYDDLLEQFPLIENETDSALVYNLVGEYYEKTKDLNTALEYHQKALTIFTRLKKRPSIANTKQLLGEIYGKKKELDTAKEYLFNSAQLLKEVGDKRWPIVAHGSLGIVLYENEDHRAAAKELLIAAEIADTLGLTKTLGEIYEYLSKVYSATGDDAQAIQYRFKKMEIDQRVDQERLAVAIAQSNAAYGIESISDDLEETELKLLQEQVRRQQEKQQSIRWLGLLSAAMTLILIVSYFLWRLGKQRRIRNIELGNHNKVLKDKNQQLELQGQLIGGQKEMLEMNNLHLTSELEMVQDQLQQTTLIEHQYIVLNNGRNIKPSSIYYIHSDRNYIKVFTEEYPTGLRDRQTLSNIALLLPQMYFVRISKSVIANLSHISNNGTKEIKTNNGVWLKISPNFREEFRQKQSKFVVAEDS